MNDKRDGIICIGPRRQMVMPIGIASRYILVAHIHVIGPCYRYPGPGQSMEPPRPVSLYTGRCWSGEIALYSSSAPSAPPAPCLHRRQSRPMHGQNPCRLLAHSVALVPDRLARAPSPAIELNRTAVVPPVAAGRLTLARSPIPW